MSSATRIQKPDRTDGTDGRAVTPRQFARRFGVSVHVVLALIRTGALQAVDMRATDLAVDGTIRRPRWKIEPEAIAEFKAARSSKPAPRPKRKKKARKDPNFVEFY